MISGSGTSCQIARAILSSPLANEVWTLMLYDIEMDAWESSSKGSVLYCNPYKKLVHFNWLGFINEPMKQHFLAEVLLAVAQLSGNIGKTKAAEALVPVIGTAYGMLMKQRYHELSAFQKMVSIALANEQTHQKTSCSDVYWKEFAENEPVYDRLQPIDVSLSHQVMLGAMSTISGTFNEDSSIPLKMAKSFASLVTMSTFISMQEGVSEKWATWSTDLDQQQFCRMYLFRTFHINNPSMTFGKSPRLVPF
ncbi:LOW QUALITY PROTEIN: hypothetical protein MAR_013213 [Mya arenaria]|uniref:Uncharacterized protein n=1 Tax=Mya arenaria TaxID=6604 RepID=A0ABY7G1X1_MYAAR|nr:LOW QUALITY PROTEIN: hypothetical protein MAR_013213 [Mya arenaria]